MKGQEAVPPSTASVEEKGRLKSNYSVNGRSHRGPCVTECLTGAMGAGEKTDFFSILLSAQEVQPHLIKRESRASSLVE